MAIPKGAGAVSHAHPCDGQHKQMQHTRAVLPRSTVKEPVPRHVLEQQGLSAVSSGQWRVGAPPRRKPAQAEPAGRISLTSSPAHAGHTNHIATLAHEHHEHLAELRAHEHHEHLAGLRHAAHAEHRHAVQTHAGRARRPSSGLDGQDRPATSSLPQVNDHWQSSSMPELPRPATQAATEKRRPSLTGERRPSLTGDRRPSQTGERRPSQTGERRPSLTGERRPSLTVGSPGTEKRRPSLTGSPGNEKRRPSLTREPIRAEKRPSGAKQAAFDESTVDERFRPNVQIAPPDEMDSSQQEEDMLSSSSLSRQLAPPANEPRKAPLRSKTMPASALDEPGRSSNSSEMCDLGLESMSMGESPSGFKSSEVGSGSNKPSVSRIARLATMHVMEPSLSEDRVLNSTSPPTSPSFKASSMAAFEGGWTLSEMLARDVEGEGLSEKFELHVREVFHLFQSYGSSEVDRDCLPDIIDHLSLLPPRQEALAQVVAEVSTFESYDIQEIMSIVVKYLDKESVLIRSTFGHHTAGPSSKTRLAKSQLQPLFRALGVYTRREAIEEACQLAFIPKEAKISLKDFTRILAAYRVREGTSAVELEEATDVFNFYAVCHEPPPITDPDDHDRLLVKPAADNCRVRMRLNMLLDAVVKLHGIEMQPTMRELLLKLPAEDLDETSPAHSKEVWVSLPEFLVWMRRVRESNLANLWKLFRKADISGKGSITAEQLIRIMHDMQFTLMPSTVKSFLKLIGVPTGKPLPFDDFVNFVKAARRTQGFAVNEVEEMEALFRQFDYDDSQTIEGPELLDILAHLGHPTSVEQVHALFTELDVDRNGSLDMDEFLRFMRIHREADLQQAQARFEMEQEGAAQQQPSSQLGDDMSKLPSSVEMTPMRSQYSFDKFWSILQAGRKAAAEETRHHAGFSQSEVHEVHELFERHGGQDGFIDQAGIICVFEELNVPMRSTAERAAVFASLETSHQDVLRAERAASVLDRHAPEELEASKVLDMQRISFETLLYFLRSNIREATREARKRELAAVQQCAFEPQEVSELRNTFTKAVQEANEIRRLPMDRRPSDVNRLSSLLGEKRYTIAAPGDMPGEGGRPSIVGGGPGRRRSAQLDTTIHEHVVHKEEDILTRGVFPKLDIGAVYQLLRSMGLRPTQQDRMQLILKASELCKETHEHEHKGSDGDADSDLDSDDDVEGEVTDSRLDFANFLLLMSWIVQTDFAGFHTLAGPQKAEKSEVDMSEMMQGTKSTQRFTRRVMQGVKQASHKIASRKTVAFS